MMTREKKLISWLEARSSSKIWNSFPEKRMPLLSQKQNDSALKDKFLSQAPNEGFSKLRRSSVGTSRVFAGMI